MLSLWKLRVGAEAYYLSRVASGLEDYYTGQGETPGRWVGNAIAGLGLAGDVTGEDLQALLAGLAPGTGLTPNGERLRVNKRRVPGFDLTFSVPKSVSVVYALGDPLVQGAVVEAGQTAVAEALGWLEREACFVRRGTNNRAANVADPAAWGTRRLPGVGFVAAEFRHRTSRAGDPQLHWHVLVANVTQGSDGRWSALDGTALYRSKRAAGAIFQTVLRRELTVRLGVEWLPVHQDVAEVAGVPTRVCRFFSKRRVEIEAELDRLGTSGPAAAQAATLATRPNHMVVDGTALDAMWKEQAVQLGWGPVELEGLLTGIPVVEQTSPTVMPADRVAFVAAVTHRLTETDAVFTRHQIIQAVAALLPEGADISTVERATALVLASGEVVRLDLPGGALVRWEEMYTTLDLLRVEQRLTASLTEGLLRGCGVLDRSLVETLAAATELGADQIDAVRRVTYQGNRVEVLVGRAGTGKTTTLTVIAAAYRLAGWKVFGVAPSARAARELETHAGIEAFTIPRFHHHTARQPLTPATLMIVDEVGMATTRDLTDLVDAAARPGAKTLLAGDPRQLPEIGPGGGLAAAIDLFGDEVRELTINHRQHELWEIHALDQLRHGDPGAAWRAYCDHERIHLTDGIDDLHIAAVNDWWQTHASGAHALLLAGTRREAAALNTLARDRADREGHLNGEPLVVGACQFQVGDRVLCTRNSHNETTLDGQAASVDNGTLAVITAVNHRDGEVDIEVLGSRRRLRLSAGYLQAGHLEHGYAMTIHKAQGATCDHVYVVGPAGLYREAAYVALSRARHGAQFYATTDQAAELDIISHSTGIRLPGESDPTAGLLDRLHRSHAKTLASHQAPDTLIIDELARLPLDHLDTRLRHARTVERRAVTAGLHDPTISRGRHGHAAYARGLLAAGRRVRALDWDNVGTVQRLDDTTGRATVRFVAADGATATRTLPWSQLQPIGHLEPVPLTPDARAWVARSAADVERLETLWRHELAGRGVQPGDVERLTAAIELRSLRVTARLHAEPPDWLTLWLGPRPPDPAGSATYDDALTRLATWRDRQHLPDATPGYGPPPTSDSEAAKWRHEVITTLETRTWLIGRVPEPPPLDLPALSSDQLRERIQQLETLLSTARADQTRTITRLVEGTLTVDDLQAALAEAERLQGQRRDWIFTNWPHVVEHHELQRLAETHPRRDELAATVTELLDRLTAALPSPTRRENRTLAQLDHALQALDPGRHLAELTGQLAGVNARLATIRRQLDDQPSHDMAALLRDERQALDGRHRELIGAVDGERDRLLRDRIYRTDPGSELDDAIAQREATLLTDAAEQRPDWLTIWLAELHADGSLEQLTDGAIVSAIADLAHYRDR